MNQVSLIIPTFNESQNLPLLVEEIFSVLLHTNYDVELIIVDDNSPDGTGVVADELSKIYPIKVVHRTGKLGLGSAVREGFKKSDRSILGVMDADLSHDPHIIPKMLSFLESNDIVLGSRFEEGSEVEKWKWWRKIISKTGVKITRFLTGVKDPLSGFFFLRKNVIENVELDTVGYKILLEILVKGRHVNVKEVPFQFRIRKYSTSKLDKMEYLLFLKQVLEYSWWKLKCCLLKHKFFVGVFMLAIGLLVYHVSYRTFWMDETMVLNYLHLSLKDFLVTYWHIPDNHPPLYYFLVLVVSKIFSWSEFVIRLVSLLAGLGIVCLVYCLVYRISSNKKTACLAAFFTAFSSYFVLISQMARYHSLAAFFAFLTLYFFYRIFFESYSKRVWCWFLIAFVLTAYTDYPHFIYIALFTNGFYLYRLIRRQPITPPIRWVVGQLIVCILVSPLLWMVYNRIFIQGDGGFTNKNLLGNSWLNITGGIMFHVYVYFFGENIFPWNYVFFVLGTAVLFAVLVGGVMALRKKNWNSKHVFVVVTSLVLIVLNTLFMNVANPRYNFTVYPKFGFVAYPFLVISFVFCLSFLRSKKVQFLFFSLWGLVAMSGLIHFYSVDNYFNASYFRTFNAFEYVHAHSKPGQYLAITTDASSGVYGFYKEKYFQNLQPLDSQIFQATSTVPSGKQIWFFSTASDALEESVSTKDKIPQGYKILKSFESVPLDTMFKKYKEKMFDRPSYTYKYTVFLLEKI
jgi:dolichol-phosphate mannosyltransferase